MTEISSVRVLSSRVCHQQRGILLIVSIDQRNYCLLLIEKTRIYENNVVPSVYYKKDFVRCNVSAESLIGRYYYDMVWTINCCYTTMRQSPWTCSRYYIMSVWYHNLNIVCSSWIAAFSTLRYDFGIWNLIFHVSSNFGFLYICSQWYICSSAILVARFNFEKTLFSFVFIRDTISDVWARVRVNWYILVFFFFSSLKFTSLEKIEQTFITVKLLHYSLD